MAKGKRARHAQRASWLPRLPVPPTALALVGLAAVFVAAGALAVHILKVPAHLREEGAGAPTVAPSRHSAAAHVRPPETRAARSEQRQSPTPTPSTTTATATAKKSSTPSPSPKTTTARPTPKPSPSSSGGPLPLPTLTG